MTYFERAELAAFAYRQAKHTGNIDCVKAICYVMRNRVNAGWGDGSFMSVINHHGLSAGEEQQRNEIELDLDDRLLQMILRDIDDIYLGQGNDLVKPVVADALYFHFIDKPLRQWFVEHILHDPANHPGIAAIGLMRLFK